MHRENPPVVRLVRGCGDARALCRLPLMRANQIVVGRAEELAQLERLLTDLVAGRGRALLLRGEAGIGKSTLLDALTECCAGDVTVVRAAGVQSEAEIAFSGLSDLLAPIADRLAELPAPQSAALAAALSLGPPEPGDRLAVCVATLGLLCAVGQQRPVLAVVDDVQWLDDPSRECLLHAARRATGPVAFAIAARDEDGARHEHDDLPGLRLGRLGPERSLEVLAQRAPDLAVPVAQALADAAAGNPLALVELPATLTREQRSGVAELPLPLAPGARLQTAFARRVGELSDQARRALLVAAVYQGEDLTTVAAACSQAGTDVARLAHAGAKGLVRIDGGRVVFGHPLIRGAVDRAATAAERRDAHRALAGALAGERRAWHLAAAAVGPDEAIAAELEHAAGAAAARRGFASAATALERAARLSPDPRASARRMLTAGQTAAAAGLPHRALALLEDALRAASEEELRARIQHLRGVIMMWSGSVEPAAKMLAGEADRATARDPVLAATMLADAASAYTATNDYHRAEALAERAAGVLGDAGDAAARAHVFAIVGWVLALRGQTERATAVLAEAERLAIGLDPLTPGVQWLHLILRARIPMGALERAREEGVALCARARDAGALATLAGTLIVTADAAFRLGDWPVTDAATLEAIQVSRDAGQQIWHGYALSIRARLAAARGHEEESRRAARTAIAIAEANDIDAGLRFGYGALGFLALGLERIRDAVTALETVERLVAESGLKESTLVPWAPDLVEAYVRAGRTQDAGRVLATLTRQACAGPATARAPLARCRGMLDTDFDAAFAEALACDDERPVPFERARTLLGYGRRLHRARRRAEARDRLREALAGFERLGAAAWANQARNELRAAGARRRAEPRDSLTPQEQRVAAAVARGASNRDIATELFLGPKTVEFHLGQIYRKLGVGSRAQLVALLARNAAFEAGRTRNTES